MATINFGGLASGLDTEAIITALMDVERQPMERLENEKAYLNTRLAAFSDFEGKLNALKSTFEDIDTADELRSYSANLASEDYFSIETTGNSVAGSYDIEVVNLARVQKDVSVGYASSSSSSFSTGTIDINGTTITVESGDSLGDIADAINAANTGDSATGVSAAIIDDGTENGFRIVLTGENASTSFTASASGVAADGTQLSFTNTQTAQQATAIIDGITIVSDNNTLSNAIPGVNMTLLKANAAGETTHLGVDVDAEGVKAKMDAFVSAYNDILTFISDQEDASWANDSGLQSAKRRLQSFLTTGVGGTGSYQYLVDIGISSDSKTGEISLDSNKINDAIANDFESLEKLFLGEDGVEGMADKFINYLDDITDSIDGLYASKKTSTESSIKGLDRNIENMELRLEKRESNLRAQFEALELLMSSMNSTSAYLSQQISNMNSSGSS